MTSSETDLNEDCLRPLIDSMLEERQYALDKINEKFGTNIKVKFYSAWEKYNLSDLEIMEIEEKEEVVEEKEEVDVDENIRSDE